jgi:hypothetical protein
MLNAMVYLFDLRIRSMDKFYGSLRLKFRAKL